MIASLTLWYPSPLGRWVLRPCPWGGWDLSCAHLIRPPGCLLPLLPGSASLSLPSSHPSPSDPTGLHEGHPGTGTLPGALPAPSLVPTRSPRPRHRPPRSCCRWPWRQRWGPAAIQRLLPGDGNRNSPARGTPVCVPVCRCSHTRLSVCTQAFASAVCVPAVL